MKRKIKIKISEEYSGLSVGEILRNKAEVSSSLLKRLKKTPDGITLNGKRVFVNEKIKVGDIIAIVIKDEASSENIFPTKGKINIVFEDEDLLIVNKDAKTPIHPSKGHPYDSLANKVAFYYESKGEKFVFRCVTRLDKDTSGLCIIAKNSYVHDLLSKQMKNGKIQKIYKAVVVGNIKKEHGIIDKNIRRIPNIATIKREVCKDGGARAITEYKKISTQNGFSLIEIKLHTGRTHQIRVHLSSEGYPIAGDWLYGKEDEIIGRQALHCEKISFIHPISKKPLSFAAPLPEDMKKLLK